MHLHKSTAQPRLTPGEMQRFESTLQHQVDNLGSRLAAAPILESIVDAFVQTTTRPGKRIRPFLVLATYKAMRDAEPEAAIPEYVFDVAGAIELFHAFLLIHDDVIDDSVSRRGEPTLHKRIETIHQARPRNAEHIAMVLGDILHGYVFELIAQSDIPATLLKPTLLKVARVAQTTGAGETLEIALWDRYLNDISEQWIEQVYHLKTGVYTIESPIQIGALLAGVPEGDFDAIAELIRPIGVGFQIENDLHEVSLDLEQFQNLVYDLKCGVKTLFAKRLHAVLEPQDRTLLDAILSGHKCPFEHAKELHRLFLSSQTRSELAAYAHELFDRGKEALEAAPFSQDRKERLKAVLNIVLANRKHSEHDLRLHS